MRNKTYLGDVHIGKMIMKIANQKGISSSKIANVLFPVRYQQNADKIFLLKDIDAKDLVRISFALEYNFIERLCDDHLSNLPVSGDRIDSGVGKFCIKLDPLTKRYSIMGNCGNCDFLEKMHIGASIRKVAERKGYKEKDVAEKLEYTQSTISDLYKGESLRVKKLFWVSERLHYHFFYDLFLSQMRIIPSYDPFYQFIITIDEQKVCIENPNDESFSMIFLRHLRQK